MALLVDSGANRRKDSRKSHNMKMLSMMARAASVRLKRLTKSLNHGEHPIERNQKFLTTSILILTPSIYPFINR